MRAFQSQSRTRPVRRALAASALVLCLGSALLLALPGCGGKSGSETGGTIEESELPAPLRGEAFPPDLLFAEAEWTTAKDYPPFGDPRALRTVKDRPFKMIWRSFPPTLRTEGPTSNLVQTRTIHDGPLFETLIQTHWETEETTPMLASHWKIENDEPNNRQIFTYRLDPDARFSDGTPVTARDVYASFWHLLQEDRNDPSRRMTFGEGFEWPEVLDRLTIRVATKKLNWRLFYYFGGMRIYKADEITIPGKTFLEDWNWKFMTGSGPYLMSDLKKGESLTITRRGDWWAEDKTWAKNTYNFHQIRFEVVREQELEYEKLKADELDYYVVSRAQRWVEELPKEEKLQTGWIKQRKIHTKGPQGFSGIAFNMRRPPFNDKRVRLAFCHLFNREKLMERLFFNQYKMINSFYPGRDWGNGDKNEPMYFDPDRATELLAEAGYKERNEDGYLVGPDGKVFEVTMRYVVQGWERIWLQVKEDYEDAGIKFKLELLDPATLVQKIDDRQFTIHFQSYTGLLFPNPETSWTSKLADKKSNNNITGFKNERVDELLELYNKTLERAEQKKIIKEIDRLVYQERPYALGWYSGYYRILYWDRFGHPDSYLQRISQVPRDAMILTWWWDPAKMDALEQAVKADEKLEQGVVEHWPWGK